MRRLSLLLICLATAVAQQWSTGFQTPLDFHQRFPLNTASQSFNNGFHPQIWQNSAGLNVNTQPPNYVAPPPAAGPAEQTFTDSVIQTNGISDPRRDRSTNQGEVGIEATSNEIHAGNERQQRTPRSHKTRKTRAQVVTPPTAITESDPESQLYSLEDLKQICPPPTIKYIVLRTLKNGVEVAEEAEEVPVTTNAVAQKIAKEVQELFGPGGQPNGKREVTPSESIYEMTRISKISGDGVRRKRKRSASNKKHKHSHTTTAAPEDLEALPTLIPEEILDTAEEVVEVDDKCNSESLRKLIVNNIVPGDAGASKRNIHNAVPASAQSVDVICSTTGFTYLVTTTDHCEAQADGVICFAYRNDQ